MKSKNLRWLEVFYSIQGEGLRSGTPSVFIRMFGCNLRCKGFGMDIGELSNEYLLVDPKKHKEVKTLPLVKTGCDSYAAWDVRFKHLTTQDTIDELLSQVVKSVYKNGTNKKFPLSGIDVVITGGEPLLGWQSHYPELFAGLADLGCTNLTFETNGTRELSESLSQAIRTTTITVLFSISVKLKESGEPRSKAINTKAVKSLADCESSNSYFKFVVSKKETIQDVREVLEIFRNEGIFLNVFLMPTGGAFEEYKKNSSFVAKECLDNKWRYSPRLHIDLFGNSWGT